MQCILVKMQYLKSENECVKVMYIPDVAAVWCHG